MVVRTFPNVSSNPQGPNYADYCKYQLIKFKPWTTRVCDAWGGLTDDVDECGVYVESYYQFSNSEQAVLYVPSLPEELERAHRYLFPEVLQQINDDDVDHGNASEVEQDDWMTLCRLNPRFPSSELDSDDWNEAARAMQLDILQECANWINVTRRLHPALRRALLSVDSQLLNTDQRRAYSLIADHYQHARSCHALEPLRIIVSGTAGTGKTFLISAIAALLGESCLLTGTTGIAAFNICGMALHSTLQLPVGSHNNGDLKGRSLARLQQRF